MALENIELERVKDFLRAVLMMNLSNNGKLRRSMQEEFGKKWQEYRRLVSEDDGETGFVGGVRIRLREMQLFRNFDETKTFLGEDLWVGMDDELVEARKRLREV